MLGVGFFVFLLLGICGLGFFEVLEEGRRLVVYREVLEVEVCVCGVAGGFIWIG